MLSEEPTPGVILTGSDSVLQDHPAILVMLVRLAARGMDVPCRLGTETGEELNEFLSPGLGTRRCRGVGPLRASTLTAGPELLQPTTTTHLFQEA